jgi:hypothetical protein
MTGLRISAEHGIAVEKTDAGDHEIWARHHHNPLLDVRLATVHYSYSLQGAAGLAGYAESIADVYRGQALRQS